MTSRENQAIHDYMVASGVQFAVTFTTSGTHALDSYHEMQGTGDIGLASDLAQAVGDGKHDTPELLAIWTALSKVGPQLAELIYADAPYQIKDGVAKPASFYGATTMSEHHNHVHVAVHLGTFIQWSANHPTIGVTPVKILATKSGKGYWIVHSDGGVFTEGDAQFYGSMGGKPINKPIVSACVTPTGNGYWLVGSDGGIFAFGDAQFHGGTGSLVLNQPIVDMACTPTGGGYWLLAADNGIFTFGDAPFEGHPQ